MEKTIAVIVFLLVFFLLQPFLPYEYLISGRPWNIFLSWMFHSSFRHLAYNAISFFMFGAIAEKEMGKWYFPFLGVSAVVSGFGASLFYESFLGFSGVVYAFIGFVTARKPFIPVPAFGVPMPLVVASIFWIFQDSIGLVFQLDNIAYSAHIAGFVFGFVVGLINMKPSSRKMESGELTSPGEDWEELGF